MRSRRPAELLCIPLPTSRSTCGATASAAAARRSPSSSPASPRAGIDPHHKLIQREASDNVMVPRPTAWGAPGVSYTGRGGYRRPSLPARTRKTMKTLLPAVFLLASCTQTPARARAASRRRPRARSAGAVRPGIETFLADLPRGAAGKAGRPHHQPHGDRPGADAGHRPDRAPPGAEAGGPAGAGARDPGERRGRRAHPGRDGSRTGVPIYSLYQSEDRGPTPEMLRDVDVLVYDLQEVGGRTWTYVSTMALSMQAAARKGIPFVVLDRPNPIGGEIVEGALLDPAVQVVRGDVPHPGAPRDDGGRARHALQPGARDRRGADRGAGGELAARRSGRTRPAFPG